jgi:hypothetical protein
VGVAAVQQTQRLWLHPTPPRKSAATLPLQGRVKQSALQMSHPIALPSRASGGGEARLWHVITLRDDRLR